MQNLTKSPEENQNPVPSPALNPEIVPPLEQVEQVLNTSLNITRTVTSTVHNLATQQFECVKLLGQMQALETLNKYTAVGFMVLMRQVKESKAYKGLVVPQPDGSTLTITTFEEYCALSGFSYRKIAEDIQNLNILGEDFMTAAQKMGLGYRELRQLRTIPEEARAAIEGGEADPEVLKELLEDISVKREEDRKALEESKKDYNAQGEVLAKKDKDLNSAKKELAKLKHIPPAEQAIIQGEKEQAALKEVHAAGLELLGTFTKFTSIVQGALQADVSPATQGTLTQLTSGLCKQMADTLIDAGIDVDFRILTYPLALGDIALRGE